MHNQIPLNITLAALGLASLCLSFFWPDVSPDSLEPWKLLTLLIACAVLRGVKGGLFSRLIFAVFLTAYMSPFFRNGGMTIAGWDPLPVVILVLLLLILLTWMTPILRGSDGNLSNKFLMVLLAAPVLMFAQLAPLLHDCYGVPILGSATNFSSIPVGFLAFALGFNLLSTHMAFPIISISFTLGTGASLLK